MALGGGGGGSGAVRAGGAFVELFAKDGALKGALDRAKARVLGFGSFMKNVGMASVAAGAAILSPLAGAFGAISDTAKMGDAANAFGLTVERFSAIAGVAKSAGEDTREFIESMVTLGKVASEGAAGKGEVATQFFEALNLNAQEFAQLKPDEQFYKFFDSVNAVSDPLQRVRLLMTAFGEDGGKYLLPLLGKSGDELRKMGSAFTVTADDYSEAKAAQLALSQTTGQLNRVYAALVLSVTSGIDWNKFTAEVTNVVAMARNWIGNNKELIRTVFAVGAGLVAGGAALAAFGFIITGVVSGFTALIGIVQGAVAVIGFFLTIPGQLLLLVGVVAALTVEWKSLGESVKESWGGIVAAISSGDLEGAFKIVMATLKYEWAKVVAYWTEKWADFKEVIGGNRNRPFWADLKAGGKVIWADIIGDKALKDEAINESKRAWRQNREFSPESSALRDVERAKAERDALIAAAKQTRPKAEKPPEKAPVTPAMKYQLDKLPEMVKGAFQAPNWRQAFGAADSIGKKQLAANEKTAKNTEATNELLKKLPLAVFK